METHMKITKSKLKQIIKEEYAGQAYDEGHADSYNHGDSKPRSDDPDYLKGFQAGLDQKEKESGDEYYDIRQSELGPDRLEEWVAFDVDPVRIKITTKK